MSSRRAIADTFQTRTDPRLAVLAQWVRAGLDLIRGARTSGQGFVGGAVALWRLAQAVRLALLLARRLGEVAGATSARAPAPATAPDPAFPLDDTPPNAAALRQALEEIASAISDVLGHALHGCAGDGDRRPSGSPFLASELGSKRKRASLKAHAPRRRPLGLRLRIARVDRPPGPGRPGRRRSRPARALDTTSPPIAPLALGRPPLARA